VSALSSADLSRGKVPDRLDVRRKGTFRVVHDTAGERQDITQVNIGGLAHGHQRHCGAQDLLAGCAVLHTLDHSISGPLQPSQSLLLD